MAFPVMTVRTWSVLVVSLAIFGALGHFFDDTPLIQGFPFAIAVLWLVLSGLDSQHSMDQTSAKEKAPNPDTDQELLKRIAALEARIFKSTPNPTAIAESQPEPKKDDTNQVAQFDKEIQCLQGRSDALQASHISQAHLDLNHKGSVDDVMQLQHRYDDLEKKYEVQSTKLDQVLEQNETITQTLHKVQNETQDKLISLESQIKTNKNESTRIMEAHAHLTHSLQGTADSLKIDMIGLLNKFSATAQHVRELLQKSIDLHSEVAGLKTQVENEKSGYILRLDELNRQISPIQGTLRSIKDEQNNLSETIHDFKQSITIPAEARPQNSGLVVRQVDSSQRIVAGVKSVVAAKLAVNDNSKKSNLEDAKTEAAKAESATASAIKSAELKIHDTTPITAQSTHDAAGEQQTMHFDTVNRDASDAKQSQEPPASNSTKGSPKAKTVASGTSASFTLSKDEQPEPSSSTEPGSATQSFEPMNISFFSFSTSITNQNETQQPKQTSSVAPLDKCNAGSVERSL